MDVTVGVVVTVAWRVGVFEAMGGNCVAVRVLVKERTGVLLTLGELDSGAQADKSINITSRIFPAIGLRVYPIPTPFKNQLY